MSGPVYTRYENNSITWEVGEKINLGIDLQLLNSLNIVVDIFRETRRDIFQKKELFLHIWEPEILMCSVILPR